MLSLATNLPKDTLLLQLKSLRADAFALKQLVIAQAVQSTNVTNELKTQEGERGQQRKKLLAKAQELYDVKQSATEQQRLLAESRKTIVHLKQVHADRETSMRRELLACNASAAGIKQQMEVQLEAAMAEKTAAHEALRKQADVVDEKVGGLLEEIKLVKASMQTLSSLAVTAEGAVETWKGRCESTQRMLDEAVKDRTSCATDLARALEKQQEQEQQQRRSSFAAASSSSFSSSGTAALQPAPTPPLPLPILVNALANSKDVAEEQLCATRALLSAQLTTLEIAELSEASKETEAACAERFRSVAAAVASLDATQTAQASEHVGVLQTQVAKAVVDADALATLHQASLSTVATLTKTAEATAKKLAETQAGKEKLQETLGAVQAERGRLDRALKESKQVEGMQKARLLEMAERVVNSEKESSKLRADKLQCEHDGAAARFQLNKVTVELQEMDAANDDFEREAARANKLGEQAKRLKRTLEAQEIKLAATTQKLGHERGRRLDAEAMLDDASGQTSAPASVPKLRTPAAGTRPLKQQQQHTPRFASRSGGGGGGAAGSGGSETGAGGGSSAATGNGNRSSGLPSFPRA